MVYALLLLLFLLLIPVGALVARTRQDELKPAQQWLQLLIPLSLLITTALLLLSLPLWLQLLLLLSLFLLILFQRAEFLYLNLCGPLLYLSILTTQAVALWAVAALTIGAMATSVLLARKSWKKTLHAALWAELPILVWGILLIIAGLLFNLPL